VRSDKEVAQEALRRGKIISKRKAHKTRLVYTICSVAACLVLIIGLSVTLPAVDGGAATPGGLSGAALFAGGSAGGYVLIGIIGFILGAIVVLLYKKGTGD